LRIDENHVEFGLFFSGGCSSTTTATASGSNRSSSAYAPLLFEGFDEFRDFEDGQAAQFFNDFVQVSHVGVSVSPFSEASDDLRAKASAPARNHCLYVQAV
jgi:hypothetical protein